MNSNLNLARKWRPKNFDQIVGQQIPISILKNSLFLKKFFPVYLFAGQRGCGKTTTARVFGAALNCQNLEKFQEKPTENKVPCLQCDSCKAMQQANHPDFIEIDAASHTGVENVRQILENCSYMPILGSKKIYLIDEAHMLSKAAFNAFLKILEEPPSSALFILATTEIQKFPETVLSRCFQVIFKSVENNNLIKHLQQICTDEKIDIDDQALNIIIQETDGSVRDAINLLERVRFSQSKVTAETLMQVLGKVSEKELLKLFELLLEQNPSNLLNKLNSPALQNINPQALWNSIIQLCRTILWIKFKAEKLPAYFADIQKLKELANNCSVNRLNAIFQLLWSQEELFLKTPQKEILLETILLQICQQTNIADLQDLLKHYKNDTELPTDSPRKEKTLTPHHSSSFEKKPNVATQINQLKTSPQKETPPTGPGWGCFLEKISKTQDPFLISILSQAQFAGLDQEKKVVNIRLSNNSPFFKDKIKDSKNIWISALTECFMGFTDFNLMENNNQKPADNQGIQKPSQINTPISKPIGQTVEPRTYPSAAPINLSNKSKWPKANLILKYFPGKIKSNKNYS